jgi:hypothetical protein
MQFLQSAILRIHIAFCTKFENQSESLCNKKPDFYSTKANNGDITFVTTASPKAYAKKVIDDEFMEPNWLVCIV